MNKFFGVLLAAGMMTLNVAQAAILTGKITLKGTAPAPKALKMNADPQCLKLNPKGATSEEYVVGKDGSLANVLVYIKEGLTQKSPAGNGTVVVFDQQGCRYHPHVFALQLGQTLEIRNSDPTLHNVHAMPKANPQFNAGMPIKDMKITRKFEKPEIGFKIKCDVHPWMKAWGHVLDHPYFAVSTEQGTFDIKNLPAGKYTVTAWHEELGSKDATVTVADGKPATVNFEFAATAKK